MSCASVLRLPPATFFGAGRIGRPRRPGFTLLELLVVVAIISVAFGLLLAAVQRVRASSARLECANRLRQITIAAHHYHDALSGLPPGISYRQGVDPYPFLGWTARLTPYLERDDLWRQVQPAYAVTSDFRRPPHPSAVEVRVFTCPSDPRCLPGARLKPNLPAFLSYLGNEGIDQTNLNGVLFVDSNVRWADISDGLSNTLLAGERPTDALEDLGWWYGGRGFDNDGTGDLTLGTQALTDFVPNTPWLRECPAGSNVFQAGSLTNECDALHFWSLHPGGAHFAFCDGSVRFLGYSAASVMKQLATRGGGESVTLP